MFALEATEIAMEHGIDGFCASWRWQCAFKARHRLSMKSKTHTGQKAADLANIAVVFAVKVRAPKLDLRVRKVT
ncbi:hypothetical protein PHMEG_0004335 [Phytophthora megakarya]|uniref:HTH CENPB-type domain-containing protein n=1 Tax=Phytophthora megakarya TaxID=4795 RepID=A0A225WTY6_9STRA|nr:hypothetical protein PHMEG_0004335 [Phytophthora megakarya]